MVSLSVKTSKCFRDNGKWLQQLSVFVSDVSNLLLVLGLADLSPQEQELLRKIRKKKNEVLDEIKVLYKCFTKYLVHLVLYVHAAMSLLDNYYEL